MQLRSSKFLVLACALSVPGWTVAAQSEQPADAPAGARAAFVKEADRMIRDRNHSGRSSEHYRVQTDDPRVSAQATAALLESFYSYFESFWSDEFPLADPEGQAGVYLFYSYFKYNQLLTGKQRFDEFRTSGHYRAFYDVVAVHTDSIPGGLADTVVHEVAHQLAAQRMFPGVDEVSPWLSEGLASYFGFTRQNPDGTFEPGVIGGKSIRLFPRAKRAQSGTGWQQAQAFRKSWKKGTDWPLRSMIELADSSDFMAAEVEERYVASWLLVHFLLHGKEGALKAGFLRYLHQEAQDEGSARALYAAIEMTGEQLEAAYSVYVRGMKPTLRKR